MPRIKERFRVSNAFFEPVPRSENTSGVCGNVKRQPVAALRNESISPVRIVCSFIFLVHNEVKFEG